MSIGLEPGQRGALIGQAGCGKSTLGTNLVKLFLAEYPTARVGLVDSKPRYRADFGANGVRMRYKHWAKGDTIRDSIAVYRASELDNAFKFTRCAILQSLYPNRDEVPDFEDQAAQMARWLFRKSWEGMPTLLYVDEYYDILAGALAAIADKRVLRVTRAGREFFMASLFGAQRPKSIPLPTLTEANKYYIFNLEYEEDVKYFRKHGPQLTVLPQGHTFVYFERLNGGQRVEQRMRLALGEHAA